MDLDSPYQIRISYNGFKPNSYNSHLIQNTWPKTKAPDLCLDRQIRSTVRISWK